MRTNVITLYIPAMAVCCFLVARATISSADARRGMQHLSKNQTLTSTRERAPSAVSDGYGLE
jgi:hypothetical protein